MISTVDALVVPGLTESESAYLNKAIEQLRKVSPRNTLRENYYDAEAVIRHLGIAIPPQLQHVSSVVGWPAKAVNVLDHRLNLSGFRTPDGSSPEGLDVILDENRIEIEASQAHITALKFGCSFVAVTAGDTLAGEPEVVIRNLSPRSSTALWDRNKRRAVAALSIIEWDYGYPTQFVLLTDEAVIDAQFERGRWVIDRRSHNLRRCPVAVLPFQPSVERPLGRSRITRPVMAITDRVIRTLLRVEVGGEFYTAPRSVLLGADESQFEGAPAWATYLSKLQVIPLNEADGVPQLESLPQMSMQPHIEALRADAGLFTGETDIPVHLLGIIHDNPASDAAMHTTYLELNKTAERATAPLGAGWVDVARMALSIQRGMSGPPDDLGQLRATFRDPSTPTLAASADATFKLIQAGVLPAESEVALERLGFDEGQIERIKSERARAAGSGLLDKLTAAQPGAQGEDLKAKFDALGVAIRAGVSPESAAAMLGLQGVDFTGAIPSSLRVPEDEAAKLEES